MLGEKLLLSKENMIFWRYNLIFFSLSKGGKYGLKMAKSIQINWISKSALAHGINEPDQTYLHINLRWARELMRMLCFMNKINRTDLSSTIYVASFLSSFWQIQFRSKVNDCNTKHKFVGWYSALIPGCCLKYEACICFGMKAKLITKRIYIT